MSVGVDASNDYWWRGLNSAEFTVQPCVSFDYERGDFGLSLGAWGAKSISGPDYKELDLFVEASWKNFTLSATDYYDGEKFAPYNASHSLDLGLSYTLSESVPLTLTWSSIVLGTTYEDVCDIPSYVELDYEFSLSVLDFNANVGFVPFKSDYYEAKDAEVTNVSLRGGHTFDFGKWGSLPVSAQYLWNPAIGKHAAVFTVGYSLTIGL